MSGRRSIGARRSALTLLEVMLAMGLLVILSSMTYWFYFSSLKTKERGTAEAQRLRLVRATLDRIGTEIRQASIISTNQRVGLRGEAEHIWLSSIRLPGREIAKERRFRDDPPAAETDLVKVEYRIARHPDIKTEDGYERALGLARVEIKIPRADSAQTGRAFEDNENRDQRDRTADEQALQEATDLEEQDLQRLEGRGSQDGENPIEWSELYAPEIKFLRFCYFDGHSWWDDWDVPGESPLPQMVQVTIGFTEAAPFGSSYMDRDAEEYCSCMNNDPEDCLPLEQDRYMLTIRIPQADPLFRSRISRESQSVIEELAGPSDQGDGGS